MKNRMALRDYIEAILVAITISIILHVFVVQGYIVSSGSMENTLMTGDLIFVNKLVYRFVDPKVNDIIVFEFPQNPTKDYVKRIVATPGQTIEIRNKCLFVDGKLVPDFSGMFHGDTNALPADSSARDYYGPVTIPPGNYFMMGDNRDDSEDSRFWGFLDRGRIKGKAVFIYFSLAPDNPPDGLIPWIVHKTIHIFGLIRWNRLFTTP